VSGYFAELHADNRKIAGEPPENTCPLIDKILRDLRDAADYAKNVERDTAYEHNWRGRDCRDEIENAMAKIEQLRKENERLRELGREWYANASDYVKQADEMLTHAEADRDTLAAEVTAWRYDVPCDTTDLVASDGTPTRLGEWIKLTDASGALQRAKEAE
jgi:hypothetical protein